MGCRSTVAMPSPPIQEPSQSLAAHSVRSRSVAGGDGRYGRGRSVGHYTLTSNTEPSCWGGGRSPVEMQTLQFHVPYSLAARRASRLARCGRGRSPAASVGAVAVGRSVTIPSPPILNPLGGAAFGRGGRSPVKTRARTLLTRRSQSLAARSVRSVGGGRSQEGHQSMGCRSAVAMPAKSPPIQEPSQSLAAR